MSSSNTFQHRITDKKTHRTVRTSYINCMHKAEFQWFSCWSCLSSCYCVTKNRSLIEANHFTCVRLWSRQSKQFHTNRLTNGWRLCRIFHIVRKHVTFLYESPFTLASSVEDVPVIFKWNGTQSFGKALVGLYKHELCITESYFQD